MKTKHLIVGTVSLVALLAVASYFSPQWTLYQMKGAIKDGKADSLSEHVDFPALRASLKSQMLTLMSGKISVPGLEDNPIVEAGQAMALALINPMVDAMVSPAGVVEMMKNGGVKPGVPGSEPAAKADNEMANYSVSYRNWNNVVVRPAEPHSGTFIFRRDGLWSWKLSAIELTDEAQQIASVQ